MLLRYAGTSNLTGRGHHNKMTATADITRTETSRPNSDYPLLTVNEVAALLNVSERTVENEIAEGKLVPLRIRGTRRFRQQQVDDYLRACTA
jgi:excisionase family DNA binding protein